MFENFKGSLFNDNVIQRSQQRFKSDHHNVYTEGVNKIALNSNDDIKEYKHLIELQQIHMVRMKTKCQ